MNLETSTLLEGIVFPESPRWHDGNLWFSDLHAQQIIKVDLAGNAEKIAKVTELPSCIGWLPDRHLLVVSALGRKLLRLDSGRLHKVADLSGFAAFARALGGK